jgi:hypothetical protein
MTPGPQRPLTVFLSYTSDLAAGPTPVSYVDAAQDAVVHSGHAVARMSYFGAADGPPPEVCRERLRQADLLVGLVGNRHGSTVPGRPESYCEFEFSVALDLRLPKLMFLLQDENTVVEPAQQRFRQRLAEGGTVAYFRTAEELRTQVLVTLMRHDRRPRPPADVSEPAWDWRELEMAICAAVPEISWCARYLAGLITGARSEIPVEIGGGVQFMAVRLVGELAAAPVAERFRRFVALGGRLAGLSAGVRLRQGVELWSADLLDLADYLRDLRFRFPDATASIVFSPSVASNPQPARRPDASQSAMEELDTLRGRRDWSALAAAARRHVDASEHSVSDRARSSLLTALFGSGTPADLREAVEIMTLLAARPGADAWDLTRAASAVMRSGRYGEACELMMTALDTKPFNDEIRAYARELALRTGSAELRRKAEDLARRRNSGRD